MEARSSANSRSRVQTASRAWGSIVAGYSSGAVGLVAFLATNGASGIPAPAAIGAACLIAIGLVLPAAGMLQLSRGVDSTQRDVRYGFGMQAFGLLGLLSGVVLVVGVSSLSGYLVGAVLVGTASVSAIVGAFLLRTLYKSAIASSSGGAACLISGTVLTFSGVGLIVGSDIAFEYWISTVENAIFVDLGATASACGCVLAAYSFFVLHNRG